MQLGIKKKILTVSGVILGALIVTTLGIDAADTLKGSRSTLLGQLITAADGACPAGMIESPASVTFSCVDVYEASPSEKCSDVSMSSPVSVEAALDRNDCQAISTEKVSPWSNVNRADAQLLCTRSGKRLPTASEWYEFSIGTPDDPKVCNTDTDGVNATGDESECVSALGIYDAIGNVWEWVQDDVYDGTYDGRPLPSSGYVTQIDSGGVPTVVGENTEGYNDDYFWSKSVGVFAMMRGGFYGSGKDGGVYAVHAATDPNFTSNAIGFRCVQ